MGTEELILSKSIEFEQLKEVFLLIMDELDANFMEDLNNTSPDFMKDYLKACGVAKKMGRRYDTNHVQEYLETK